MSFKVIPAIDVLDGRVVRLFQGRYDEVTHYFDDPVDVARRFRDAGYDLIHLVNLSGARSGGIADVLDLVKGIASLGLEVQVGGGVRQLEEIEALLSSGAERVIVGTKAFVDEGFLPLALERFGRDSIVVGMDVREGRIMVKGWEVPSGDDVNGALARFNDLGLMWLLCTDISRDGSMQGVNVDLYDEVCLAFRGNVIASGGVRGWEDVERLDALSQVRPNLFGVIVGRFFYESGILDDKQGQGQDTR